LQEYRRIVKDYFTKEGSLFAEFQKVLGGTSIGVVNIAPKSFGVCFMDYESKNTVQNIILAYTPLPVKKTLHISTEKSSLHLGLYESEVADEYIDVHSALLMDDWTIPLNQIVHVHSNIDIVFEFADGGVLSAYAYVGNKRIDYKAKVKAVIIDNS
jgi:hypothetical protein